MIRLFLVFIAAFAALPARAAAEGDVTFQYGNISVQAPFHLQGRIKSWLQQVESSKVGAELLREIRSRPHQLHIQHLPRALQSAGKTLTPLSRNMDNGVGVAVVLAMNFEIPDSGSHEVWSCLGGRIPFTALTNFIHELRHARDAVTGNFIGHRFEKDAVDTENEYRRELGIPGSRCLRSDEDHIWQIWFPG